MDEQVKVRQIQQVKSWRLVLDHVATKIASVGVSQQSREKSLALTRTQEAIMWCGMELKRLNQGVSYYPEGKNPDSAAVDQTPDGVLDQNVAADQPHPGGGVGPEPPKEQNKTEPYNPVRAEQGV